MMGQNGILAVICACIGMGMGAAYAEIPEEVTVGGVFDITGNWATEGEEGKTAAQLAILDFNRYLEDIGADWRMKMRVEDAQALGSVAFDKVTTLHGSGINILLGMAFSSHLSLSAGYIESNNMLALSCCSQAGNLEIDDNIFRLVPNDNNQAPAVNAMIEDAGIEVLVMVTRGDTWGDGIRDTLIDIYDGTAVEGFRYHTDAIDFSSEISLLDEQLGELIDEHGADKVGVFYVGTDEFLLMVQQMRFYDNVDDVRWFSTNTQASSIELVQDDDALAFTETTMFTATRQQVGTANHLTAYVDALLYDTYGRNASPYSYAAYDSVWLLGTAILQTESTETDDLVGAMPLVAERMLGASGPLRLTDEGDLAHASYVVMQIRNGEWVQDATYDPITQSIVR